MQPSFRSWWQRPVLHPPGEGERRVSWLELFYDLVFVVIVSQLAHEIGAHPSAAGALHFALFFGPAWWVWVGGTLYSERFETYDMSYRAFTFLQMLAVGIMAASAGGTGDARGDVFALGYAGARALITFMWWRAGRHIPQVRPVTTPYTVGFSTSVLLWVLSVWAPEPWAAVMRAAGLLIDLTTPIFTLAAQTRLFRGTASKVPERYGLFVIIVLGESLAGIANGLAGADSFNAVILWRFVLGFAVGFGLWWVYFDFVGRRKPRPGNAWTLYTWSYLHLPMVMGIAAVGGALAGVVGDATLHGGLGWVLAGGFAVTYAFLGLIELTLQPETPPLVQPATSTGLKLVTAALAILTPLLEATWAVLLALVALHLVNMGYGLRAWYRGPLVRENHEYH